MLEKSMVLLGAAEIAAGADDLKRMKAHRDHQLELSRLFARGAEIQTRGIEVIEKALSGDE